MNWWRVWTLTCSDDDIRSDPFDPFLCGCRPVHLLHADRRLGQTVQLHVASQFVQDAGVTVTEHESVRTAGATDGDTGQPDAAAQLQNRPADRSREDRWGETIKLQRLNCNDWFFKMKSQNSLPTGNWISLGCGQNKTLEDVIFDSEEQRSTFSDI